MSTRPRRGDLWHAYTPSQPRDPHQPRPVLVISVDGRNEATNHVMVIPIYTHGRLGPSRVAINRGLGGINHDSVLFCEELTTIDQAFLTDGPLGPPVPDELLDSVVLAVHNAIYP